jgi:hypothetical protein
MLNPQEKTRLVELRKTSGELSQVQKDEIIRLEKKEKEVAKPAEKNHSTVPTGVGERNRPDGSVPERNPRQDGTGSDAFQENEANRGHQSFLSDNEKNRYAEIVKKSEEVRTPAEREELRVLMSKKGK